MTTAFIGVLVVLALVDSTSFGTLLIPIWLLLTPGKLRISRLASSLGTVVLFYFLVGLALAAGADSLVEALREPLDTVPSLAWRIIQLVVGIVLIILSYVAESRIRRSRADGKVGRLEGWRSRALSDAGSGSAGSLVKLALVGTSIEMLTMLPYLAAIAMLTAADLSPLELTASITVYCLVMVIPAIVLCIGRIALHERVDPTLRKINDWFSRHSDKAVGWTLGGIGIGVAANAVINLVILATQ